MKKSDYCTETGKRYLLFLMILDEEEDISNHSTILLQGRSIPQ